MGLPGTVMELADRDGNGMGRRLRAVAALFFLFLAGGVAATEFLGEPITPIPHPAAGGASRQKVELGRLLFHDRRLSADNSISCADCHDLAHQGVDGRRLALGIGGAVGRRNTPTVFNSRYNIAQFWDGRAATLEEQAAGPLLNPREMGGSWPQLLGRLQLDDDYRHRFDILYADGITAGNVRDAIAAFERTLVTLDAPFDRYLRGDSEAITAQARNGYQLFKHYGCIACHQGMNVGGNMYSRMGAMGVFFTQGAAADENNLGRYSVTGNEEDRFVFKVPSLRLAALTPPYFHDGSIASLEEAIRVMGRYQLGRQIADNDVADISAFIRSLQGEPHGVVP